MIGLIKLHIVASYLYNFKKCKDHDISIGYAYGASSLAVSFFIMEVLIITFEALGKSELIDKYIIFGNGLSFGILYCGVLIVEVAFIKLTTNFLQLVKEFSDLDYLKRNLGIIYIGPVLLLGAILLVLTVITAPDISG